MGEPVEHLHRTHEAAAGEEGRNVLVATTQRAELAGVVLGGTRGQDEVTEALTSLADGVHRYVGSSGGAGVREPAKPVGVESLGPQVGVVTCGVPAGEDVLEARLSTDSP